MAHELELLKIIRHISSVYQDLNDTGTLTEEEIVENEEIGNEVADCLVKSLSLEIVGTDGDTITVKIKTLDETWQFVENYWNSEIVKLTEEEVLQQTGDLSERI